MGVGSGRGGKGGRGCGEGIVSPDPRGGMDITHPAPSTPSNSNPAVAAWMAGLSAVAAAMCRLKVLKLMRKKEAEVVVWTA